MTTAASEARMRPLIDVLGRTWSVDSPVLAVVFNRQNTVAAFALDSGDLVLARCDGDDIPGANHQPKSDGTIEITPSSRPPAPLTHVRTATKHNTPFVADIHDGFLGANQDGDVFLIEQDGQIASLYSVAKPVYCVAAAGGLRACALEREIYLYKAEGKDAFVSFGLEQSVNALAFNAQGDQLAIAHDGGIGWWSAGSPSATPLHWPGQHKMLAWSPDSRFIASCGDENKVQVWRFQDKARFEMTGVAQSPTCLSWAGQSQLLVSDGDARVVCWPMAKADQNTPLHAEKTGIPSEILVTCVSCHPQNNTIAAGYANGAVLLCRHGQSGELFVKGPGGGAIQTVSWSSDGRHLAFGGQQGLVAVVSFPIGFFK